MYHRKRLGNGTGAGRDDPLCRKRPEPGVLHDLRPIKPSALQIGGQEEGAYMTFVQGKREAGHGAIPWHIAIYVRLSKEDGDKLESDSIQNQKGIIEQHIKHLQDQGECIASTAVYSDDGYPGGSFDRPAYRRMIADIEAGAVNCVIVKDNSRLGRNYPELGRLMEEYFPQKGTRVISVLNHIDSFKDPHGYCSAMVSFSNIMNDDYIRQLSLKIKSTFAMKRERGEFLGNYAPYGYRKSPEDRHKLIVDPEAAETVRMIFHWYASGASASGIVKQLNALQIPPPSLYKAMTGCKGFASSASRGVNRQIWSVTSVNTMLRDEVYIGNLVQGKFKSASYRTKKMVPADESEWTVVEGTHEAIIPDEIFAVVHERLSRRTRVAPNREAHYLLSGFVRCAHCGGRMNRNVSHGQARFRCITRIHSPETCQCPSVKESTLEDAVLAAIQTQIRELVDAEQVVAAACRRNGRPQHGYLVALRQAEQKKKRLSEAQFRLYDNLEKGIIDQEEYRQFKERYYAEIAEQDVQIRQLQDHLAQLEEAQRQDDAFVAFFKENGNIPALDRDVLGRLLDHIEVTDAQHLDIYFTFSAGGEALPDV